MNSTHQELLDALKRKVSVLISSIELMKQENEEMKETIRLYENNLEEKNIRITELEQKLEQLQLVDAFKASANDVTEAKKRIKTIVREIDRCMALIDNLQ